MDPKKQHKKQIHVTKGEIYFHVLDVSQIYDIILLRELKEIENMICGPAYVELCDKKRTENLKWTGFPAHLPWKSFEARERPAVWKYCLC